MIKVICKQILKTTGWKIAGNTNYPGKCVICVAPHTSNWDLFLGLTVYTAMGRRSYFLMKKSWFFFPLGILFKAIGGIPVDRNKKTALTDQLAEEYAKRDNFQIAITPEGTRKKNNEWKKGFYYIALAANVPIVIVSLNYKDKIVDFKSILIPSGNIDADMKFIKDCYRDASPRHPEKFALE